MGLGLRALDPCSDCQTLPKHFDKHLESCPLYLKRIKSAGGRGVLAYTEQGADELAEPERWAGILDVSCRRVSSHTMENFAGLLQLQWGGNLLSLAD